MQPSRTTKIALVVGTLLVTGLVTLAFAANMVQLSAQSGTDTVLLQATASGALKVENVASDGGTGYVKPYQLAKPTGTGCVAQTVHAADAGTMLLPTGLLSCKAYTDVESIAFNAAASAASEGLMRGQSLLFYNSQPDAGFVSASLPAGAASVTGGVKCCPRELVAP